MGAVEGLRLARMVTLSARISVQSLTCNGHSPPLWWIRAPAAGQPGSTSRTWELPTTQPA